jgi:hypothetical protein
MTAAARLYLERLCREAGERLEPNLPEAETSRLIDELQDRTSRSS